MDDHRYDDDGGSGTTTYYYTKNYNNNINFSFSRIHMFIINLKQIRFIISSPRIKNHL